MTYEKNSFSILLSLSVLSVLGGCSLDDPRANGEKCEAAFIMINDEQIKPGDRDDINYYFDNHVCPTVMSASYRSATTAWKPIS